MIVLLGREFCRNNSYQGGMVVRVLKSVQDQLKRNHVIEELKKFNVFEIDGNDLSTVKYSVLLRKLAAKRAAEGTEGR